MTLLFLSLLLAATPEIKVDQAGYLPNAPKLAFVVSSTTATEFSVHRAAGGAVVFRGKLAAPVEDRESGDRVQAADFSAFKQRGTYYLEVPGVGRSWQFTIAPDAFSRAFYLAMRSYYGQRCGVAVDLGPEFPGYTYPACHLQGAWHASSGKTGPRASVKGWHDAGDYGRYVVNSGITTGTLLWTWELYGPRLRNLRLNLPESGNGTPDILNEIRWNLDWMLSMQDADGGVFHKQTTERFSGFVMPDQDKAISVVIGAGKEPYKSTCATADFAAVMAVAARVYKPFDAVYAERTLNAARQAFAWAEKNPAVLFRNPAGVNTGAYGDRSCADERLWAAAELWRTTREPAYEQAFLAHYGDFLTGPYVPGEGWAQVASLGLWTYLLGGGADKVAAERIRTASINTADAIVARSRANGYRISMQASDYVWGSNAVAANYGMLLLVADRLRRDPRYVETALDNLHYLLGRNTFSVSWLTQVGENAFRHPHHRPSGADKNPAPWPGLLSGGPNAARQDASTKALPAGIAPAKVWVDEEASYASNEVAINWNAPLVLLLASTLPEK